MKPEKSLIVRAFFFIFLLSLATSEAWTSPNVIVYAHPNPSLFGRDTAREKTLTYDASAFSRSSYLKNETPFLVPVIIPSYAKDQLKLLARGKGSVSGLVINIDQNDVFTIKDRNDNVSASFELIPAPESLFQYIKDIYANSFWQDMVIKSYQNALVFNIYGGNDLDRDGVFSYKEALAIATLLGERTQPLLGIHDGAGYLENIAYSVHGYDSVNEGTYRNYRNPLGGDESIRKFISGIDSYFSDFPTGMYTAVTGAIQYEDSHSDRVLLPEKFLFGVDGDKIDFALAFYDLLLRKGYDTKLLAVKIVLDDDTEYVTVFKQPETFSWSAVYRLGLFRDLSESIDDIPALLFKHTLLYAELDAGAIMVEGTIPDIQSWKTSEY